jgi:Xaa-Pro aminopeptidase
MCFGIMQNRFRDIQKYYNIVKGAKEAGFEAYKSGFPIRQADAKARFFLKKQGGFDRLFTHSLGHGMGIDVHEPPAISAKEKIKFKPGMVLSCEPGIYMEGKYGIRIEDDYLITKNGPEKLGTLNDGLIIKD